MKTKTINVYEFKELDEKAQDKVRSWYQESFMSYDWYESTYEYWKEKLHEMGYYGVEINFSGFYSQGDGACFSATVGISQWIKSHDKKFQKKYSLLIEHSDYITMAITTSGRYSHEHSMSIDYEYSTDDTDEKKDAAILNLLGEIEALVLEDARDQARTIYRDLEKEYEYLVGDEAMIESLEANEYEFDKLGRIV